MKRWLVISHEATNSGAPRMLLEVLRGVRKLFGASWECEIIFNRGGPLLPEFCELGRVRILSHPWTQRPGRVAMRLGGARVMMPIKAMIFARWVKAWKLRGGGVVYGNTGTNGRLLAALPGDCGVVVSHIHELGYGLRRFNRPAELGQMLARTHRFIAVSSAVAHDLTGLGVAMDKIKVVPNFLSQMPEATDGSAEREAVCRRLQLMAGARLITGCGHIDAVKGTDLFVEMARWVAEHAPQPVVFIWLGGDVDRVFAKRVRVASNGLVRFIGAVTDPSLYFAASEGVVVTSRAESFSRVVLEAGALGRPVLAFRRARGPVDLLDDESLINEFSAQAMGVAVCGLLASPEQSRRSGQSLRARIAEGYLAEHWTHRLLCFVDGAEK